MIKIAGADVDIFKFPKGEINVKVSNITCDNLTIIFVYDGSDSIIELLLAVDAIRRKGAEVHGLVMDYVPFGRQDRVVCEGESLSLKVFCDLINSLQFEAVYIQDAHSPVTTALLNNCVEEKQHEIFKPIVSRFKDYYLISPDGGALKKIYQLAKMVNSLGVIECTKERDVNTGDIKRTIIHHHKSLEGKNCIIVDDICDGGRTFIEIAKVLKRKECGKIVLCVTHGFFTKGMEVFNGLIDSIYTNKGRIK